MNSPRTPRRDHRGRFVTATTLADEVINEAEFVRRGLTLRGEAARQRALQVRLVPGDPIGEAIR